MAAWLMGLQAGAAGLSIASALGFGKKSNKMSAEQIALLGEQANIARDMRSISGDQQALYDEYSDPVFENIFEEVFKGPDYEGATGRATSDVNQVFDQQQDAIQRQNFRYGVNPASGSYQDDIRRNGVDRSLALVTARNRARREEDDKNWARLMTGADFNQQFIGNAINAGNAALGGMNQASSGYGNAATRSAQSANNGVMAGMYLANQVANGLDSSSPTTTGTDYGPNGIDVDQWLAQPGI